MPLAMCEADVSRCQIQIIMHKPVAVVEVAVEDEVDVGVHEGEGEDDDVVFAGDDVDAVHAVGEVCLAVEHHVNVAADGLVSGFVQFHNAG